MTTVHACWKLARVATAIATGLGTIVFTFPRLSNAQKEDRIQAWARQLLAHMAIDLQVQGQPASLGPVMLAANHISWLDIVVLLASRPCRFVAKAEVQRWPVLGRMAQAAGTLFITRESNRDAVRVVHHMADSLRRGEVLAIFPEGTTSDGRQVLPFHANLFQAAVSAGAPVQPVALQFLDAASNQTSLAPCYIDDDTMMGSIWRTLKAPPLCVRVTFGPLQPCQGHDRRGLASAARESVETLRQPA